MNDNINKKEKTINIIIDDKTSAELAKEYKVDADPAATMQYYSVCSLRS